jgi:hypothetical protein
VTLKRVSSSFSRYIDVIDFGRGWECGVGVGEEEEAARAATWESEREAQIKIDHYICLLDLKQTLFFLNYKTFSFR